MNYIMNRIFTTLAALAMVFAASCTKVKPADESEILLEVNSSNLRGSWSLETVCGESVADGTFFYIEFDRSGDKFQIWENLTAMPSTYNHSEGTFKLYTDPELGVYIRGIDNVKQEWRDMYVIKELRRNHMVWWGKNDPSFIQTFKRVDKVPFAED